MPERAIPIFGNLLHSIKLIGSKVLPDVPISGNVKFEDPWAIKGKESMSNLEGETGVSNKEVLFNQSYFSSAKLMKKGDYLYSESQL